MNAKSTKKPAAPEKEAAPSPETEQDRVIDNTDAPPAEEEIIDIEDTTQPGDQPPNVAEKPIVEPADASPPMSLDAGNLDTTHPADTPPADDPVIDLADTRTEEVGHVVLGGGAGNDEVTPAGITAPIVEPVQDIADMKATPLSREALNRLDDTDPSRSAILRSQANWLEDSKKMFKGPTQDQLDREDHIKQLDAMDNANRAAQKKDQAARLKAEEIATRSSTIAAHKAEYETLKTRALFILSEIERLESLTDEPEPEPQLEQVDPPLDTRTPEEIAAANAAAVTEAA